MIGSKVTLTGDHDPSAERRFDPTLEKACPDDYASVEGPPYYTPHASLGTDGAPRCGRCGRDRSIHGPFPPEPRAVAPITAPLFGEKP